MEGTVFIRKENTYNILEAIKAIKKVIKSDKVKSVKRVIRMTLGNAQRSWALRKQFWADLGQSCERGVRSHFHCLGPKYRA